MNECFGKNFILNGDLIASETFENALVYEGESIYEVLRMERGRPVFFNDHMDRLSTSVKLQSKNHLADNASIRNAIQKLTRSDKRKLINLKIVFNYNGESENYLIYFIEPIYPSAKQYGRGVRGVLFYAERKDPESKVINHKLRSSIYHKLIIEGGYEALLVNQHNQITEGSRSNIFFVKDETLYTAPESIILNGITRLHILDICKENGIKVIFEAVDADEISHYDAVFMTGTSPVVLPFCCIDSTVFAATLPLLSKLRKLYMQRAEQSIRFFMNE